MSELKIAVVVGSTRPGRSGRAVAEWVLAHAQGRPGADYELVDLLDHQLPLLDEPVPPAMGQYTQEHTREWAATVDRFDGYVFVTPEYNHSTSGALKNAIDYVHHEWHDKAAALVGYGSVGGARAVEHLRGILSEQHIAHVRQTLAFNGFTDFENFTVFKPAPMHAEFAAAMFDQLEAWAGALRALRVVRG